jgi:hypothetical protein
MAWRMDLPPLYSGSGSLPSEEWAVVYRDELEPSLPEYVCITWRSRNGAHSLDPSHREVTGGLSSFVSANATHDEAVAKAKSWLANTRPSIPPGNVLFWGVVRSA